MEHVADLPAKLDMMLKAMSLSRVALAQQLGVDKSLVGRWLAGSVHPTEHNLARLTTLVASSFPGFCLADWSGGIGSIAQRHGLQPPPVPVASGLDAMGPLTDFLELARPEIARRGGAYEGFWRTWRPSIMMGGRIFHDYAMVRRTPGGLLEVLMEGSGLNFNGWAFPIAGNFFIFLFDKTGGTPMTAQFKGVSLPKATVLDGILLLAALDPDRTPAALPVVVERLGDLSGDSEADLARFREFADLMAEPAEPLPVAEITARLSRDIGPAAAAAGGEAFLAISSGRSLSRGVTAGALRG